MSDFEILLFLCVQLASAPAGLSITEMEMRQFQALFPDVAQEQMFCYFRDPNITKYAFILKFHLKLLNETSSQEVDIFVQ